ncbi:MAG: hypothetical protein ACREKL_00370 [Chthoniobacterales bacterium]
MISLSLGSLVGVYAAGLVLVGLLLWLCTGLARGSAERRRRRCCIQCMFCGAIYEATAAGPLHVCPQCTHPNERTPPPAV